MKVPRMDREQREDAVHEGLGYLCILSILLACLISGDDSFGEVAVASGFLWFVTSG